MPNDTDVQILAGMLRMRAPDRARDVITHYGSMGRLLSAARDRDTIPLRGVSEAEAATLQYVARTAELVTREAVTDKPLILGSWDAVITYARVVIGHAAEERFFVLFLDRKNGLIAADEMSRGTVDHAPVYPREVAKRALLRDASAVILVHNHPSGDPTPSRADIDMTRDVSKACAPLGITVHDHLVVTPTAHASLRSLGHMCL